MTFQDLTEFQPVLNHFNISQDQLIGKGGEGYVFNLDDKRVIKIYKKSSQPYLEELQKFQQKISKTNLPYQTPLIEKIGTINNIHYTIEARLEGENLESVFAKLSAKQQEVALSNYIDAIKPLENIDVTNYKFGQVLKTSSFLQSDTWKEFLLNKLDQKLESTKERLNEDVNNFHLKLKTLKEMINTKLSIDPKKSFVHGDYYLNNVLVNDKLQITTVLDISDHTCVGDHKLDVANINFLSLCDNITPKHISFVRDLIIADYGEEIIPYLDLYGFYYAFYFSNLYTFDMKSYEWCLSILNDENRWAKYF